MNPLNLPGPEFLAFYAALVVVVLVLMVVARRIHEAGELPVLNDKDPFLLACLRGGPHEVVRVAMIGLLDRGVLKITDTAVMTVLGQQSSFGNTRVERDVIEHFRSPAPLNSVYQSAAIASAGTYESTLSRLRLIPDDEISRFRNLCLTLALALLFSVGAAKLINAWLQSRSNIWFLVGLMAAAAFLAWRLSRSYRTRLGDRYLKNIRSLFSGLRLRASSLRPGGGTRELLWLTALFGVVAVPATAYPFAKYFQGPSRNEATGSGCGSSGGSSCGGGGGGCGGCGGG